MATAASFKLDLVAASNADAETHPIAQCLASVRVNLAGNATCDISLTPLSSGGSYVPGIWAGAANDAATGINTYTVLRECSIATGAVVGGGASTTTRTTALTTAFNQFVYGDAKPYTTTLAFTAGEVIITLASGTLTYAVTEVRASGLQAGCTLLCRPVAQLLPQCLANQRAPCPTTVLWCPPGLPHAGERH